MIPLPPTSAQLRLDYAPFRTWAALSMVGLAVTVVRHWLYDVPFTPFRSGMTPFLVLSVLGGLYAFAVLAWLELRRLYVR